MGVGVDDSPALASYPLPACQSIEESRSSAPRILAVFLADSCVRALVSAASLLLLVAVLTLFKADMHVAARVTLLVAFVVATPLLLAVLLGRMNKWRLDNARRISSLTIATVCAFLLSHAIHISQASGLSELIPKNVFSLLALLSFSFFYPSIFCFIWLWWLCPANASFKELARGASLWWLGVLLSRLVPKVSILFTDPGSIDTRIDYITLASGRLRGLDWFLVCVEMNRDYFVLSFAVLVLSAASAFFAAICHRVGIRNAINRIFDLAAAILETAVERD